MSTLGNIVGTGLDLLGTIGGTIIGGPAGAAIGAGASRLIQGVTGLNRTPDPPARAPTRGLDAGLGAAGAPPGGGADGCNCPTTLNDLALAVERLPRNEQERLARGLAARFAPAQQSSLLG